MYIYDEIFGNRSFRRFVRNNAHNEKIMRTGKQGQERGLVVQRSWFFFSVKYLVFLDRLAKTRISFTYVSKKFRDTHLEIRFLSRKLCDSTVLNYASLFFRKIVLSKLKVLL